jgi:hypothetical protein
MPNRQNNSGALLALELMAYSNQPFKIQRYRNYLLKVRRCAKQRAAHLSSYQPFLNINNCHQANKQAYKLIEGA